MTAPVAETTERETIVERGLLIDVTTGEIVGPADTTFRLDRPERVEWLLERRGDIEAELRMLEAKERDRRAFSERQIAQKRRNLESLDYRFMGELQAYAESHPDIASGRRRSIVTSFGEFGFRKVKGTVKILADRMDEAVEWAKRVAPGIVRVREDITVTDAKALGLPIDMQDFVETTPGGDRFYAKTSRAESDE